MVAFLAGAPEAPWREPELAAAARCGLSTGGLDIVLLAPEAELGAPAVAALRGLIGALDSGVDAGLPGGFVGSGCGTRRPCRLVALPAPEALLDAWQQHELLLEALDVPGARAGDPAADQGGPIGAACMPGQSRHAGRAMQGGPGSAEGGAQAGPRAGAAAAEQAAAGGALDANFSAAVESAWRSATAAVAGAGAGAPQAGAREGLGTLSRGAVGHERTSQAALGPPVGAQGGRAAPSADAANPANPRPAASPGALPALLRRRAGVLAPARCRDESLDALGHLSSDGFMRPWLPSYANVPVGLRSGSEGGSGGRAGGSGGGGGGRGGADRLVYVLMYRLDMPQWRVLAVRLVSFALGPFVVHRLDMLVMRKDTRRAACCDIHIWPNLLNRGVCTHTIACWGERDDVWASVVLSWMQGQALLLSEVWGVASRRFGRAACWAMLPHALPQTLAQP